MYRYASTQGAGVARFVGVAERAAAGGGGTRPRGAATTHDGKASVIRAVHAEPSELGRLASRGTASLCNVGGLFCQWLMAYTQLCVYEVSVTQL